MPGCFRHIRCACSVLKCLGERHSCSYCAIWGPPQPHIARQDFRLFCYKKLCRSSLWDQILLNRYPIPHFRKESGVTFDVNQCVNLPVFFPNHGHVRANLITLFRHRECILIWTELKTLGPLLHCLYHMLIRGQAVSAHSLSVGQTVYRGQL